MEPVTLSKPITHGEKTYNELTFREATVSDLIAGETAAGQGGTAIVAATLAVIAEVSFVVMKKVSARDFIRISEATQALLGNKERSEVGES